MQVVLGVKARKPLVIVGAVVALVVLLVALAFVRPKAPASNELAFLSHLRYTVRNDGNDDHYRITEDPAVILSTIPDAVAGKKTYSASNHATTYDFYFPSGRRAMLLIPDAPGKPCALMIDHDPSTMGERVERKLFGY